MNLGIVLAQDYYAAALAERDKVVRAGAKRDRRTAEIKAKDCVSLLADEFKGRGVSSVRIVTDAVRRAIDSPRELGQVVLLRLSSPEGKDSPPLVAEAVARKVLTTVVLSGGRGFDGRTISPINEAEIRAAYREYRGADVSFVVSSPFSELYPEQESAARDLLLRLGARGVWCSSEVSSIPSVLDRESTAILSAAASKVVAGVEKTVARIFSRRHRSPKVFFGRNNGTVASAAYAKRYPLETYWSLEGSGISGASSLSGAPRLVAAGRERNRVWFGGASGGLPIMREIAYIRGTLVHVPSPLLAELTSSTPEALSKSLYAMFSDLVGTSKSIAVGPLKEEGFPMAVQRVEGSEAAAAVGAAMAGISLDLSIAKPKGYDEAKARAELRQLAASRLSFMGARRPTIKLAGVVVEPGYNMPEGSMRLSVRGTARAG